MEIIKLNCNHSISLTNEIIATIGEFDGIHIAHQMLFKKTLELAKESNKKSDLKKVKSAEYVITDKAYLLE